MLFWKNLVQCSVLRRAVRKVLCRNMSHSPSDNLFIWMDLEMTGLNEKIHHIIEIACIVTTTDLCKINDGIHIVVHQSAKVHEESDSWSLKQHSASGLRHASIKSNITIQEADSKIFEHIRSCRKNESNGNCYLAGNSVYMDKRFIEKYLPSVNSLLSYRILDITSIKLLNANWYSSEGFKKRYTHRALPDLEDSINELKYYRDKLFKKKE